MTNGEGQTARKDAAEEVAKRLGGAAHPKDAEQIEDDIEAAHRRGMKLRAYAQGAGLAPEHLMPVPQQPQSGMTIRGEFDIGEIVSSTMKSLTDLATRTSDPGTKTELATLRDTLKDVQHKLDNPPRGEDPIEQYKRMSIFLTEFGNMWKNQLGLETKQVPQPSEYPYLLEMEDKKIEREERGRQHDERMMVMQRQWKKEDQRFWAEMQMSQRQSEQDRQLKGKALTQLEDIAGATVDAIRKASSGAEVSEDVASEGAKQSTDAQKQTQTESIPQPTPFTLECPNCGDSIMVEAGVTEVICTTCGKSHNVDWSTAKSA